MDALVSPYHFTTREAPVMAAVLLADQVYTLLPSPQGVSPTAARSAADRVPEYLDMIRSWRWSQPLWEAGVVLPSVDELAHPAAEMASAWKRLTTDPACAALGPLMRLDLFGDEDDYLQAVARDVLRAGPDPGVSVPVMLGLDRYAARHALTVVRPEPSSVVQKAEARLSKTRDRLALVLPVLLQADADSIVIARDMLEPELEALRAAMDAAVEALHLAPVRGQGPGPEREAWCGRAREAATRYADAFDAHLPEIAACQDEDAPALMRGLVSVTLSTLPVDVVLHASAMATERLGTRAPRPLSPNELAPVDELASASVSSMVVRVMSKDAAA
ncbi:hypothetical protein AY599_05035 [Leptolyngbya valderiana BDU 20041]|nr:hypothetical protein AY599_05035 [Leptolyngbya valderiana BDU 20041]